MSIAFLYGKKFVGPITPTILALRDELYSSPYHKIDWSAARNSCAEVCHYSSLSLNHYYSAMSFCTNWLLRGHMCNIKMAHCFLLLRDSMFTLGHSEFMVLSITHCIVLMDGESTYSNHQ